MSKRNQSNLKVNLQNIQQTKNDIICVLIESYFYLIHFIKFSYV